MVMLVPPRWMMTISFDLSAPPERNQELTALFASNPIHQLEPEDPGRGVEDELLCFCRTSWPSPCGRSSN